MPLGFTIASRAASSSVAARVAARSVPPLPVAVASPIRVAHADTREVAARVTEQWRAFGARTTAVPTRFLFDEESVLIPIPKEAVSGGEADPGAARPAGASMPTGE